MQTYLVGFDPRGPGGAAWFVEDATGERAWAKELLILVPMRCQTVEANPRARGYGQVFGQMVKVNGKIAVVKEGDDGRPEVRCLEVGDTGPGDPGGTPGGA